MTTSVSKQLDTVFTALADNDRRRLVHHLSETTDNTATIEELVAVIEDDPKSVKTQLRHVHLPHLDSAGLVDYDDRTRTVRYRGSQLLEDVLTCCRENRLVP